MLNKVLMKELIQYFYDDDYDKECGEDVNKAHDEVFNLLGELSDSTYSPFEDAVMSLEVERELQGFLRGYEYCLTMMGLMKEGEK